MIPYLANILTLLYQFKYKTNKAIHIRNGRLKRYWTLVGITDTSNTKSSGKATP
jgi:hypothetical protein